MTNATVYSFGGPSAGTQPEGSLTTDGTYLYGLTYTGGANGFGTVYKFDPSSSPVCCTPLHCFGGYAGSEPSGDGAYPRHGNLQLIDGDTLFGMTTQGGTQSKNPEGSNGQGTVFCIGTDGSGYEVLHRFSGGSDGGSNPHSCVVSDGSTLYGMTQLGGPSSDNPDKLPGGLGTLFQQQLPAESSEAGLNILHYFDQATGGRPHGQPLIVDSDSGPILYGMTRMGGKGGPDKEKRSESGLGVVFSFALATQTYTVLHYFEGGHHDGATPYHGNLTLLDGVLYGMTHFGGSKHAPNGGKGVIFQLDINGDNFQVLHRFAGNASDGGHPLASLTPISQNGTTVLYGTAGHDGPGGNGIVFSIDPDGTNYKIVYSFSGQGHDGRSPAGDIILLNGNLYGTTRQGGQHNEGTIFAIPLN